VQAVLLPVDPIAAEQAAVRGPQPQRHGAEVPATDRPVKLCR
jgi:hypothetical protein